MSPEEKYMIAVVGYMDQLETQIREVRGFQERSKLREALVHRHADACNAWMKRMEQAALVFSLFLLAAGALFGLSMDTWLMAWPIGISFAATVSCFALLCWHARRVLKLKRLEVSDWAAVKQHAGQSPVAPAPPRGY